MLKNLSSQFLDYFEKVSSEFEKIVPSDREITKLFRKLNLDEKNQDPWGLDIKFCKRAVKLLYPLYKHYFKVRIFGLENLDPEETYVMASNHSGQIAIDGMLIGLAMMIDNPNPRIVRPMIERFMTELPFVAQFSFKGGAVLGDRQNCLELLERDHSVLVFPEGVRGVSKSTTQFYELQGFTKGFYRMALAKQKKVLPIAVIGAEEIYPFVYQAKDLAKLLGLPALPITPFFPWFGLIGAMPLPSPIDIYIGKPVEVPSDLSEDAPDKEINIHIKNIEESIQRMINEGLEKRRDFIDAKGTVEKIRGGIF